MDWQGGDLCQFNMTSSGGDMTASLAECTAACCADERCQHFVIASGSKWAGHGVCKGKPKCHPGDNCCFLKGADSVATPRHYCKVAGSVTNSTWQPPSPPALPAGPGPVPPPGSNAVLAFGFTVDGQRKALLVNTGSVAATLTVAGGDGAQHAFVDEHHGHGTVPAGSATLGASGLVEVQGYGISVLSFRERNLRWPAKTDDAPAPQLPGWFLKHRTHAHTRLPIDSPTGCKKTSEGWTCAEVFENAGSLFAELGVPAYVRHSHTGGEGLMWPSKTVPRAGWHPMVQDTGRNLPREFLAEAKEAGVRVIFYHYMKCQPAVAAAHPDWIQRTSNGSAMGWSRCPDGGLSTCVPEWRKTYIDQIVEVK